MITRMINNIIHDYTVGVFVTIVIFESRKMAFSATFLAADRRPLSAVTSNFIQMVFHSQNEMNGITSFRDCYWSNFYTAALWQSAETHDNKLH